MVRINKKVRITAWLLIFVEGRGPGVAGATTIDWMSVAGQGRLDHVKGLLRAFRRFSIRDPSLS